MWEWNYFSAYSFLFEHNALNIPGLQPENLARALLSQRGCCNKKATAPVAQAADFVLSVQESGKTWIKVLADPSCGGPAPLCSDGSFLLLSSRGSEKEQAVSSLSS